MTRNFRFTLLFLFLLLPFIFRQLGWFGSSVETHVRLDGCIMGVLLAAIRYDHNELWNKILRVSRELAIIGLILYILFFYQRWFPIFWLGEPDFLGLAFIFGSWVVYANSSRVVGYRLYFPGAYYISSRSYSIYLLHPDAIAITNRLNFELSFFFYFLIVLSLSLIASEALYRAVELPFMQARSKLKWAK